MMNNLRLTEFRVSGLSRNPNALPGAGGSHTLRRARAYKRLLGLAAFEVYGLRRLPEPITRGRWFPLYALPVT